MVSADESDGEKVVVMGKEVPSGRSHRRFHHHSLLWGAFLVFVGVILLLNTLNLLSWSVWGQLWHVWPLFLILAGLKVILGDHPISRFIFTVITVIFFFILALIIIYLVSPGFLPSLYAGNI